MSHNFVKPSKQGFCEAIFSSSPTNFEKENKVPIKKTGKTLHSDVSHSSATSKNKIESKQSHCTKRKVILKDDVPHHSENIANVPNVGLNQSKSTSAFTKQESMIRDNTLEEKLRTPIRSKITVRLSDDKTSLMHLCTPKQFKTHTPLTSTKMNLLPATRTPVKHYFSDVLCQATPDCFSTVQVETPHIKCTDTITEEQTVYEGENSNLTVGIRVRPLHSKELDEPKISKIVKVTGQNIIVDCESSQHTFTYDHCFISHSNPCDPGHASQETIFKNMVLPLVQNAFEGYNVCLFAYGQTGSGKSYSMMGTESSQVCSLSLNEHTGIIPRFCQEIFSQASKNLQTTTTVEISYFEIYNEKIHDLLASTSCGTKKAPLKVREHPVFGPYIVDLSQNCVQSYKDLQAWLKVGNSQRATAATGINEKSSRSHSIFSIILTQTQMDEKLECKDASRRSKINLVDLAGSERLSQTCASGDRLKEGVSINKSLLTLGKVIAALAENVNNRKRGFVPYRDSVLTWLLKESLGGNSKTAMLGTVSPANIHLEETLATLRYACQVRAIVNRVRINEDPHDKIIRELRAEVLRLRGVREGYERQLGVFPRRLLDCIEPISQTNEEVEQKQQEIDKLKDQLKKTEEQLAAAQMTWLQKLQEAEKKKNLELKYLRRCGIALEINFHEKDKLPCLINLAADPMLSGTLLYLIPQGLVRIGKNSDSEVSSKILDIVLDGPLVRQLHCTIENSNGKLILTPEMDGNTYVNGQVVIGKVLLKHGDRLVIGGNHYFKVSNPHDTQRNVQVSAQVDFEYAHKEILRVQEEKLRAELEESKQKAIKELENAKREIELQLGSQKSSYEEKIEVLGTTLEEQKLALEEINRKKRELELEKELLVSEVEANNKIKRIQHEESKMNVSPYKSNFLQELECILAEKTADVESALKMKISTEAINAGGITLHEMQIFVREATERCREIGLHYEFSHQQTVINKNLQSVVRIRDKGRMLETFWKPMRFLDWVHRLRDYDIDDSIKELRDSDAVWEAYEDSEIFEDSLNNSRISINMTPVKKQLNESLHQLSMDMSVFDITADQTFESTVLKQNESINACLIQMEVAAKTLSKLCRQYENQESKSAIIKTLSKVQSIITNILEAHTINAYEPANMNSIQSINDTVIEKLNDMNFASSTKEDIKQVSINLEISPDKSSLRNDSVTCSKSGSNQKTVRFTDKT